MDPMKAIKLALPFIDHVATGEWLRRAEGDNDEVPRDTLQAARWLLHYDLFEKSDIYSAQDSVRMEAAISATPFTEAQKAFLRILWAQHLLKAADRVSAQSAAHRETVVSGTITPGERTGVESPIELQIPPGSLWTRRFKKPAGKTNLFNDRLLVLSGNVIHSLATESGRSDKEILIDGVRGMIKTAVYRDRKGGPSAAALVVESGDSSRSLYWGSLRSERFVHGVRLPGIVDDFAATDSGEVLYPDLLGNIFSMDLTAKKVTPKKVLLDGFPSDTGKILSIIPLGRPADETVLVSREFLTLAERKKEKWLLGLRAWNTLRFRSAIPVLIPFEQEAFTPVMFTDRVAFFQDGKVIRLANFQDHATRTWKVLPEVIGDVALSPDKKFIATRIGLNQVAVYQTETGWEVKILKFAKKGRGIGAVDLQFNSAILHDVCVGNSAVFVAFTQTGRWETDFEVGCWPLDGGDSGAAK